MSVVISESLPGVVGSTAPIENLLGPWAASVFPVYCRDAHGRLLAAAVQVADHLVRHAGMPNSFELVPPLANDAWTKLEGWDVLYGADGHEAALARASLANALHRLPAMLSGLL